MILFKNTINGCTYGQWENQIATTTITCSLCHCDTMKGWTLYHNERNNYQQPYGITTKVYYYCYDCIKTEERMLAEIIFILL